MAQSLSKIHIRMNAFALPGRTNENTINTQGVASLALGYALVGLSARPCLNQGINGYAVCIYTQGVA